MTTTTTRDGQRPAQHAPSQQAVTTHAAVDQIATAQSGPIPVLSPPSSARHREVQPRTATERYLASRGTGGRGGAIAPVQMLLILATTLAVVLYARFLLDPSHRGDLIPYILVITAETALVLQALLSMWTILSGALDPRDFAYYRTQDALFAPGDAGDRTSPLYLAEQERLVDVLITVYGEPVETVRRTIVAALAINGLHRTWVLDDGCSDDVRELCVSLGARYVRRPTTTGSKAGNINYALTLAKGDFFVILDADFVPAPEFLTETVPFFGDPSVAFVQTPQVYGNLRTTVAIGAAYMQSVFYRLEQPGRNHFNAAICVGTNVIFRRASVDEVGGLCTDSKSEDIWTSLLLHEKGWSSIYVNDVLAIGDAPETIEAYSKQQLRWATGGFEIFFTHNPLSPRRKLSMDQRVQYLASATFYFTGICPLLLILLPPLEIYLNLRPVNANVSPFAWALYYSGFYLMQIVFVWYTQGTFRWQSLTLAIVSFPIYTRALINVLTGTQTAWNVTGRRGSASSPFNFIVPQLLFFVFLSLTSVVGIARDIDNQTFTLATAWNLTNTIILGAFVATAWREDRAISKGAFA